MLHSGRPFTRSSSLRRLLLQNRVFYNTKQLQNTHKARFSTKLDKPFPNNSQEPVIAKAQHDIFGIINSYENFPSGQKTIRGPGREKAIAEYYPEPELVTFRNARNELKILAKRLQEINADEKVIEKIQNAAAECYTEKQKYTFMKREARIKKGKMPTRKFQGKRAMKKKK